MSTLLVTGANRGLGLEFVRSYAAEGWQVHACCRQPEKADELKALEGQIAIHRLDVNDGLQVSSLARKLADEDIDLLINNAGIFGPRVEFGDTDYEAWMQVFHTNSAAPLRMIEAFVEHLGRGGPSKIINISSVLGSIGGNQNGGCYIYGSSKAALNYVTRSLSIDLAPKNIHVYAMHPGYVQTDMGGAGADITAAEAVEAMRDVIGRLDADQTGRFYRFNGEEIPW